jgi:hypothetical protein
MSARLAIAFALLASVMPARAADDVGLARLATCRDSWFDWQKTDPDKLKIFAAHFRAAFTHKQDTDAFLVPNAETTIEGLHVTQVFPESVGMGVGFSLMVDATFDKTRKTLEKALGRTLEHCETGDDMKSCGHQFAEKRTLMLMAEDSPQSTTTLVGCYYFYEK